MTQKIHTKERECWYLTERLHQRTLTVEHDRNMDEYDRIYINKKIIKMTNMNGEICPI